MVTSAAQASLKRTEVDSAIVIGNDDLAVDQRTDGQGQASLHKLWELRRKIAAVCGTATERPSQFGARAGHGSHRASARAPHVANGKPRLQLRQHRNWCPERPRGPGDRRRQATPRLWDVAEPTGNFALKLTLDTSSGSLAIMRPRVAARSVAAHTHTLDAS